MADLKLYTLGVEDVAWVVGYSNGSGSQSKESDHLYVYAYGGGAERTYVTDLAVNLTAYSKLWIDWSGSSDPDGAVRLVASTSKTSSSATYNARLSKGGSFSRREDSLDVSGLSGDHYIRIHAAGTSEADYSATLRTYKIWLESASISIWANVGGVWKQAGPIVDQKVNIGGVWKAVAGISVNIGGVWKPLA